MLFTVNFAAHQRHCLVGAVFIYICSSYGSSAANTLQLRTMEFIMKKLLLASSLFLALGSAQAAEAPKWDFVDASYLSTKADGDRFNGLGLSASKLINENVFVLGSYSYQNIDEDQYEADINGFSAGVGYRHAVAENTDVFGAVEYIYVDADAEVSGGGSFSDSENGYGMKLGVRSMLTNEFEVQGVVNYVDLDGSDTSFTVKGLYHFNKQFALGAGFTKADDADTLSATATYFF